MRLVKSVTILFAFALPALAGFHARALPHRGDAPGAPLPKASAADLFDVIGFWSKSESFGDAGYLVEFYFGANGRFESRMLVQADGMSGMQAFGTWKSAGSEVRLEVDPRRCLVYDESGSVGCADADPDAFADPRDTLLLLKTDGIRTLLSRGDGGLEPLVDYVGPQRAFMLPDLFAPVGLGARPVPARTRSAPGFQGTRDLLGRDAGSRVPRTPHVRPPASPRSGR